MEDNTTQQLTLKERMAYEDSLKYYRDIKNSLDTAFDEGKEEGREEGIKQGKEEGAKEEKIKMAQRMKAKDYDVTTIKDLTSLSETEINQL